MSIHSKMKNDFFATTPKGLELLLVDELRALGAEDAAEKLAGVKFSGDLELAYKACLWSRLANRILLTLTTQPAKTPEELYAAVHTINWNEHIDVDGTFAVHFVSSQSEISHTLFGAQKVKDAIVDQFREKLGTRPNVAKDQPQVSVYVYLHRDQATISIDLSGDSLHRRGYRLAQVAAPLKENLAAALLLRAKWPQIAKEGGSLLDPMCGSGTLLIEGAMIAGSIAPGLARDYFGFLGWKKHDDSIWQNLLKEAQERRDVGLKLIPTIVGNDNDPDAIAAAFENIERAGLLGKIHVEKRDLDAFIPKTNAKPGLVITNPPYGERLGEVEDLKPLYAMLGNRLKQYFEGWHAAVFTGNPDLGKFMGLRAQHGYALYNGALPCKLLIFDIAKEFFVDNSPEAENERRIRAASRALTPSDYEEVQMFVNRLKKNYKHLKRQAERKRENSFRLYDADIPEYAFLIDIVEDKAHVQEYEPPKFLPSQVVLRHRNQVLAVLPEILDISPSKIFFNMSTQRRG